MPTAHSPCHCPPCPVGTEPQSYFRPFRGRPGLGKSEVLAAGHNCLPQKREGHSLGLASLVWWSSPLLLVPTDPQQSPPGNQCEGAADGSLQGSLSWWDKHSSCLHSFSNVKTPRQRSQAAARTSSTSCLYMACRGEAPPSTLPRARAPYLG